MKAHTSLEQSQKLAAGILPHDTADGTWKRIAIAGCNLDVPEEQQYFHDGDMPFMYYSGVGIPSWSLATLLEIIRKAAACDLLTNGRGYRCHCRDKSEGKFYGTDDYCDDAIDACIEVIIKLHEQKLL